MKKVMSPFNYRLDSSGMEHNSGVIVTVPGQSMTPKEILQRFRAGMPVGGSLVPLYESDDLDDLDDPTRDPNYDMTDLPEYVRKINERKKAFYEAKKASEEAGKTADDGGSDGKQKPAKPVQKIADEARYETQNLTD